MRDSTLHFLPQEILTQILTKLPAKSLVRLRCVSKFFCSLITDPLFADLHRNWSLTIPGRTSILISLPGQVYMSYAYYTINYNETMEFGYLRANRVLYLDEKQWNFTRLDSSAHGLLCLSTICDDNSTALCNLSTRKHTFLPRISLPHHYLRWARTLVGFDPIPKKYKLFKSGVCVDNLGINTMWKHWVFTLGVDTSWREINCVGFYFPTETYRLSSFDTSVYIDGVIYSSNLLKEHKNRLNKDGLVPGFDIAAFDVGTENFRWISFPDDYSPTDSVLVDMDGRLAIIQVRYVDTLCRRYNIEIWSLEKSMKWGMRRTIPIPLERDQLVFRTRLTTTRFGEIVLLIVTREFVSILVYELGRQVWRMFKICGLHDYQLSEMNRQIVVDSIPENMFFP